MTCLWCATGDRHAGLGHGEIVAAAGSGDAAVVTVADRRLRNLCQVRKLDLHVACVARNVQRSATIWARAVWSPLCPAEEAGAVLTNAPQRHFPESCILDCFAGGGWGLKNHLYSGKDHVAEYGVTHMFESYEKREVEIERHCCPYKSFPNGLKSQLALRQVSRWCPRPQQ